MGHNSRTCLQNACGVPDVTRTGDSKQALKQQVMAEVGGKRGHSSAEETEESESDTEQSHHDQRRTERRRGNHRSVLWQVVRVAKSGIDRDL
jgi:hypothetical protein